jgi:hypothetical protein
MAKIFSEHQLEMQELYFALRMFIIRYYNLNKEEKKLLDELRDFLKKDPIHDEEYEFLWHWQRKAIGILIGEYYIKDEPENKYNENEK